MAGKDRSKTKQTVAKSKQKEVKPKKIKGNKIKGKKSASAKTDNTLVFVAKSPIHGKGLFAATDIPADTVVGLMQSKPTRRDGDYVLWLSKNSKIEIINEFKYINHSDKPNVALYDEEVVSLRKIKASEELTHNYNG